MPLGWAESFIGEMCLHFYDIPADLEIVNGIPESCHAPESVFHNRPLSFSAFKTRLEGHFQTNAPPIMIDDGFCALSIVGIGTTQFSTTLWMADPHIEEGINQSSQNPHGLYTIDLDSIGAQISCSVDQEGEPGTLLDPKELYFDRKYWMVLFPHPKKSV
jgi:hypothetical protein